MALVSVISVTVMDAAGSRESVRFPVAAAATLAEIQALSDDIVAAFEDLTGGFVESASVTLALSLPAGTRISASDDHYVQTGWNLGYSAADTIYKHTVRIPAVNAALVTNGILNTGNQAIIDFNTLMVAGDGTTQPTDKYGNDIQGFTGAIKSFRK